jgi:hypothetical protein
MVLIAISKQSVVARICQIPLAAVVWVAVQVGALLTIGAALIGFGVAN